MATVYRKKNTQGKEVKYWYCFFRVTNPDGTVKQVHKSTKKTTKKEAIEAARDLEKAATRAAGVDCETQAAIMAKVSEAAEKAFKNKLSTAAARLIIGEIMEIAGQGSLINHTLRSWASEWLKEKELSVQPSTMDSYRSSVNEFIDHLGTRADKHIELINTEDIRGYRDKVRKNGLIAKTCNNKVKALRLLFRDAVKHVVIIHDPTGPIKPLDESDSVQRASFTVQEIKKLIKHASTDEWKGVILFGVFTGLRLRDIIHMKVGNLDTERKLVSIIPRKTRSKGTVVEIRLHGDILKFLEEYKLPPFDSSPVFNHLSTKVTGGRNGLSSQFISIMEKAGVERHITRKRADGAARDISQRSFHSLRHTFTSLLANANVPEEVRMKMTGHTDTRTHQKYTHEDFSILQNAVDRIGSINPEAKRA